MCKHKYDYKYDYQYDYIYIKTILRFYQYKTYYAWNAAKCIICNIANKGLG